MGSLLLALSKRKTPMDGSPECGSKKESRAIIKCIKIYNNNKKNNNNNNNNTTQHKKKKNKNKQNKIKLLAIIYYIYKYS